MSARMASDEESPLSVALPSGVDTTDLYKLSILRGVSLGALEGLLVKCALRSLEPGEVLLAAGQLNRTMHMVLSGKLSVHLESKDGDAVATLSAGETVGELSVIDARPASAFV